MLDVTSVVLDPLVALSVFTRPLDVTVISPLLIALSKLPTLSLSNVWDNGFCVRLVSLDLLYRQTPVIYKSKYTSLFAPSVNVIFPPLYRLEAVEVSVNSYIKPETSSL